MKGFKICFALWIGFFALQSMGQVNEAFNDGNFTLNPTWIGDDTSFVIDNERLRLSAFPASDEGHLSTSSVAINNAEWIFTVEMNFNPSSSNRTKVYLTSTQANLENDLNGYYVQLGGTTDEVSLYRQNGSSASEIIDGTDDRLDVSNNLVSVRVLRDNLGNWELYSDTTASANWFLEGQTFDDTHTQSAYFGFLCDYTATRSDRFWFDDITVTGVGFIDSIVPCVTDLAVTSDTTLTLTFSEPLAAGNVAVLTNYATNNNLGNPTSALLDVSNPALLHLTFGTPFPNGITNELTIFNVSDLASNPVCDSTYQFLFFSPTAANPRDVVINEIYPDQTPLVGLPDAEFIELYNASNSIFNLEDWQLSDASSTATLRAYILQPNSYVILCANSDTAQFQSFGPTLGVSSFPSLNNAVDLLTLADASGQVIDVVNYTDAWYQNDLKAEGGWTLEQINPNFACTNAENWRASEAAIGGTPGTQNSILDLTPDTVAPQLITIDQPNSFSLELAFGEPLDSLSAVNATYNIIGVGIAGGVQVFGPDFTDVQLALTTPLPVGARYTLEVINVADCSGNSQVTQLDFAVPDVADKGDVIINEILFNPRAGGVDFVEIFNRSNKLIDLRDWRLANFDAGEDSIGNFRIISEEQLLLDPQQYLVLTTDPSIISSEYPNALFNRMLQMPSLPTYSNDEGTVYLIMSTDSVSDFFSYNEDLHFDLLNDVNGVSLEREDFNQSAQDVENWHSAAESEGFATPGFLNSQFLPTKLPGSTVTVSPEVFSPNNDGLDDVANINYVLEETGFVGNVTIFDSRGRTIRQLTQNELLAAKGTIVWDGRDDNRQTAPVGIYIIYVELFNLEGVVNPFKRTVVLGRQF